MTRGSRSPGWRPLLGVDKSVASRRWQAARAGGYLKNLESGRGKPARIVLADPLPGDVVVLPPVEQLTDRCTVARVAGGVSTPPALTQDEPTLSAEQDAAITAYFAGRDD